MNTSTLLQEVGITLSKRDAGEPQLVCSSIDACRHARSFWGNTIEIYESMFVIYLNNNNKIIGYSQVAQGGITFAPVDLRIIFAKALGCLATGIIILHNHPTGKLVPSEQDRQITKTIKEAGDILNIKLLDHLILTENSYLSFADDGIL